MGMHAVMDVQKKAYYLVFLCTFLTGIFFAAYTNHAWEDWYITYRCSENLALGNGLVYDPGQKVHAFTSPLGTLVPAGLNLISGHASADTVLWLFRILSCVLLGLSSVLLLHIASVTSRYLFCALFLVAMFSSSITIVDFSINGMEAAFMVFFLTCMLWLMSLPSRHAWLKIGLAWAGLLWTRPDSFVYFGGLSLGYLLFSPVTAVSGSRKELCVVLCKAGAVMAAVYVPWVIWAWHYFGSPIPHPVIAKCINKLYNINKLLEYVGNRF